MDAITTRNLTKQYKNFTAVKDLNLHIPKGKIYGIIGPNGAGKSTILKMILGLTTPTYGSLSVGKLTHPKHRIEILKKIGSFIESPTYYGNLTGQENLDILRKLLNLPKSSVDEALTLVGLNEFQNREVKKYSLGMKQRLGLAEALLGKPEILILDEPTNGLDPSGIHEIRTFIQNLPKYYNCTVLVSSHLLSEVELIADKIGILNRGHLLFEGTLANLKNYAAETGISSEHFEEIFLSLIDRDNQLRG